MSSSSSIVSSVGEDEEAFSSCVLVVQLEQTEEERMKLDLLPLFPLPSSSYKEKQTENEGEK